MTNTRQANYHGTDFIADVLYDNTQEGAYFGFTLANLEYFYQTISDSPLSHSDVGCKGGSEVMTPCGLAIKKLIRQVDHGEIKLDSALWDKNRTQIIGKVAETTYQLKKWHTEWAIHEQAIPDAALVVVAFAVSVATYGAGTGVALASSCGLEIAATGTAAAMANAGAAALFSSATTSFLRTGDPIATAKEVFSPQNLKAIGISIASAGMCSELGSAWDIKANPAQEAAKTVATNSKYVPQAKDFLQAQLLKGGVDATLNVTIGGMPASRALAVAAKEIPLNTAAAYGSYKIGAAGFQGKISTPQQDLAHTALGAAIGAAKNPRKPLAGATAGAGNALAAATLSRTMFGSPTEVRQQAKRALREEGGPMTEENINGTATNILNQKMLITTILTASATAAITRDPALVSTGIFTATNVMENNCIPSLTKSLVLTEYPLLADDGEPREVYLQNALEAAFPHEEPSRIRAVVKSITKGIKEFRRENPRLMGLVDNGLHGIGTGLQYSAYASAMVGGFVAGELNPFGGGVVGASLGLAMVKSSEAPVGKAFQYGIERCSSDVQDLTLEALPFLAMFGKTGNVVKKFLKPSSWVAPIKRRKQDIIQQTIEKLRTFPADERSGVCLPWSREPNAVTYHYPDLSHQPRGLEVPKDTHLSVREKLFGTNTIARLPNPSLKRIATWHPFKHPGPLPMHDALNFRSSTYIEAVTREPLLIYRVYGGKAKELGPYWTIIPSSGPIQSMIDSALAPIFGNTIEKAVKARVPAGEKLCIGYTAPQNIGGSDLLGGGTQVFIENVKSSWIIK